MTTLTLTKAEQSLWDALPEDLKDGWSTEEEKGRDRDTPERRRTRFHLVHLRSPAMLHFIERAKAAQTPTELSKLFSGMRLKDVDDTDLLELFFALGPSAITLLLPLLFAEAKTDDDVEDIAALTVIRHLLLSAAVASHG